MRRAMVRRPLLINIDGLDATGKSEISEAMTRQLGAVYVECVPPEFTAFRKHISDMRAVDSRYLFFMSALAYSAVRIRELMDSGRHVVVQSYIIRTTTYHRAMGATAEVVLPRGMPTADVDFLLETDERERQRRLVARRETPDPWVRLAASQAHLIAAQYHSMPAHRFDTTGRTVAESVNALLDHELQKGCHCNPRPAALPWPNLRAACRR
jgi:thymidylate kinase